jgi:HEAT repeat protein
MSSIVGKLRGGDRRSIGLSDEVAGEISQSPELFSQVFHALLQQDPVVRMRAADAIEKATVIRPELLQPYKRRLLKDVAAIDQKEVRWHVALMLPRLQLTDKEREWAVSILFDYLEDSSSIVRTFAMQGLADLALLEPRLRARVLPILEFLTTSGSPAMRSRGRKLLKKLKPKSRTMSSRQE